MIYIYIPQLNAQIVSLVLDQANVTFCTSQEGPSGTQHALLTLRRSCIRCCDETKDVMHHETPYYGVCVKTGCPTFVVPADCRRIVIIKANYNKLSSYILYIYTHIYIVQMLDTNFILFQKFSERSLTSSTRIVRLMLRYRRRG